MSFQPFTFINPRSHLAGSKQLINNNARWSLAHSMPTGRVTKYYINATNMDSAIRKLLTDSGPEAKIFIYDLFHIIGRSFCLYSVRGLPYQYFNERRSKGFVTQDCSKFCHYECMQQHQQSKIADEKAKQKQDDEMCSSIAEDYTVHDAYHYDDDNVTYASPLSPSGTIDYPSDTEYDDDGTIVKTTTNSMGVAHLRDIEDLD